MQAPSMLKRSLFLVALLAVLASACESTSTPPDTPTQAINGQSPVADPITSPTATSELEQDSENPLPGQLATVVRVIDGDTIEVDLTAGGIATVRLIGVDTPETVAPGQPVGCYGREASAFTKQLLEGQPVYLEKDVSETDRYGRLLRYVHLTDGRMVNEVLVTEGYAQVSTYPPDVKYQERFLTAQAAARDAGRGLWGACVEDDAKDEQNGGQDGNCDPAYPTVCIPPAPPDLDCGDITFRRFEVRPPDPHRFDGDSDGVGCESG